jgi:hypothetical protein
MIVLDASAVIDVILDQPSKSCVLDQPGKSLRARPAERDTDLCIGAPAG